MEQYGHAVPPEGSGKKEGITCPFCQKNNASFRDGDEGAELFKCWSASCPSDTAKEGGSWAPVSFLAWELKLSWKEAFVAYMKMTGQFKETQAVRIMPGAGSRKVAPPVPDMDSMPPAERDAALAAEQAENERRERAADVVPLAEEPEEGESDDGEGASLEVLAAHVEQIAATEGSEPEAGLN